MHCISLWTQKKTSCFVSDLTACYKASSQLKYYHSNLWGQFLFVEIQFLLAEVGHYLTFDCQVTLPAERQLLLLLQGKTPWERSSSKHLLFCSFISFMFELFSPLALGFSLVNRWSSQGINQTQCSSGWALGFAPDWVMMVDIEPSGSRELRPHQCCWHLVQSSRNTWLLGCGQRLTVLSVFCISVWCGLFFTLFVLAAVTVKEYIQLEKRQFLLGQWRRLTLLWWCFPLTMHYPVTVVSQALLSSLWWMALCVP